MHVYDVAIIGTGPASIFAALELIAKSKLDVVVLEKAKRLNDSRNVSMGWLGGSARSSVRLFLDNKFGGEVATKRLVNKFTKHLEIHGPSKLKTSKKKVLKRTEKQASDFDIEIDQPETAIYTEDKMIKLGDQLYSHLRSNATVTHKLDILSIKKEDGLFKVETPEKTYVARSLIMGMGRNGAKHISTNYDLDLEPEGKTFDLGVRVEMPTFLLRELAEKTANFRFRFGDFRTTVPNFSGTVETEELDHIKISNGRGWGSKKSHMANFALLKKFTSESPLNDVYRLTEIINVLSDGQLFRDSLSRVLSNQTVLSQLPEYVEIVKGLDQFFMAFPTLKKRCFVYAPEARLNAVKFNTTKNMETNIEGLYVVGDMSGKTRSFVQAACSGLAAAENILKQNK